MRPTAVVFARDGPVKKCLTVYVSPMAFLDSSQTNFAGRAMLLVKPVAYKEELTDDPGA